MQKVKVKVALVQKSGGYTLKVRVKTGNDPHVIDVAPANEQFDDDGQDTIKPSLVVWQCVQPNSGELYFEAGDAQDSAHTVLSIKDMNGQQANTGGPFSGKTIFEQRISSPQKKGKKLAIKVDNQNADEDPVWYKYQLTAKYKPAGAAPISVTIDPMFRNTGR